jgi:hypothetical protein
VYLSPRAFSGLFAMASTFWFNVPESAIDTGYESGVAFVAWIPDDYGHDDLLPVLHGPQELRLASLCECPF